MPSITTWTRLEPRSRHDDMSAFLQARIADPLWSLAIQARIGEFLGHDAAFPIAATYDVTVRPIVSGQASTDPQLPLDAVVAADQTPHGTPAWSLAAGVELTELMSDHGVSAAGIAAVIAAHPIADAADAVTDAAGRAYLDVVAGRLPDGAAWEAPLRDATAPGGTLPADADIPASDTTAMLAAAAAWLAAIDALTPPERTTGWQAATLAYDLDVPIAGAGAGAGSAFGSALAKAWSGDELDWYDFDLGRPQVADNAHPHLPGVDPTTGQVTATVIPHPLTYPGAPDPRYWAMEDGNVNLAASTVTASDLARLLVIEFSTVTAPDWYLLPLDLPYGALYSVVLTVTNTFGETATVPALVPSLAAPGETPVATPDWIMFRPAGETADGTSAPFDGLLLLALTADQQRSAVIESVALARDDLADLAWALETTVTGADGRPVDMVAAADRIEPPALPPDDGQTVYYQMRSALPGWAYPFTLSDSGAPLLTLTVPDTNRPPQGVLLSDLTGQPVQQQEVPPGQATLVRQRRMARGPDGQLLTWTARTYRPGGNAASIALDFDQILDTR